MISTFYFRQPDENRIKYIESLKGIAQTSKLYSENKSPFIHYRVLENIFCKCFNARNISREDSSFDAIKHKDGIGIKTFLQTGNLKFEKIGEFNDSRKYNLNHENPLKLIRQISYYKNERLRKDQNSYNIDQMYYHYVTRKPNKIFIYECKMDFIDESNLQLFPQSRQHIIKFFDGLYSYHFHKTKNTLYKKFELSNNLEEINISDVYDEEALLKFIREYLSAEENYLNRYPYVILPLFSTKNGDVPLKSGLNQWNAEGRKRKSNEIYIPIPRIIHKKFPDFFPPRFTQFNLETFEREKFKVSICQENGKALMSNPNTDLGEWLLRKKLNIPIGKVVTYEDLRKNNADTVIIYKIDSENYKIALHSMGAFNYEN
jgi:hypothetical protein